MSNSILPHLLSDSPPPLEADDEDFDDEFGDFKGPEELSFDNELPSTPTLNNSKNHFHDFSTCIGDNGYDGFKNETKEDSINSLPPKKYYSLWEQIENNAPEFIDDDENGKNNDISENLVHEEFGKIAIHELRKEDQYPDDVSNCSREIQELSENELSVESNKEFPNEISQNLRYVDTSPEDSHSSQDKEFDCDTPPETHIDEIRLYGSVVNENQLASIVSTSDTFIVCKSEGVEKSTSIINKTEENENSISVSCKNEVENCTSERLKLNPLEFAAGHEEDENVFHLQESLDFPAKFEPSEFSSDIGRVSVNISGPIGELQLDVDEFADFSCCPIKSNNFPCEKNQLDLVETFEDDFNEFESYEENISKTDSNLPISSPAFEDNIKNKEIQEVDEFDDFTCYSAHHEDSLAENLRHSDEVFKICKSPQEGFEKTCNVVEKIFPKIESTTQDYLNFDFISSNTVFENLKDITETSALSYQWDKSVAQKNLLKTLNIDVRNILYGPTWNSGVPIFAANLCEKPLEPIRSELPVPTSPQKTIEPQESAPSYPQFDWAASGLSDLQDSVENVTNEKPETLQESSNAGTGIIQPSYVEANLPSRDESKPKDENSPLHLKNRGDTDDFSDFASYQEIEGEKEESKKWNNMLPLRESHISINSQQESTETNEISRYFQDLTTGRTEALGISQLKTNSKFTFCNPQLQSLRNDQLSAESHTMFNELEKNTNKIPDQVNLPNNPVTNKISVDRDIIKNSDLDEDSRANHINPRLMPSNSINYHQEDEFTDFQSSLPCSKPLVVASILSEPLKPAVLLPEPAKHQPLKIEWPDPGLDEEEINRIVNGVLRKNSKSESVTNKIDAKVTENNIKPLDQRTDQDDWSDFMSVKEPLKARTSTPDLPLSVFNLGSIQPNRSSAPYVAPNGVVHSPSKTTMSFPIINRNTQNNSQQQSHQQPFITTQAFNALYSNTKNNMFLPNSSVSKSCNMNPNSSHSLNNDKMDFVEKNTLSFSLNDRINHKVPQHVPSSINHSNSEDDDWGDFVSAPSTVSQSHSNANFFQSLSYIKTNLGLSGKSGPVQKSSMASKNTVVRQEKNNLPIISTMPDLEFVSPKSRSSIK